MSAPGSRLASTAQARLTAAHESLGDGSTRMLAHGHIGQLTRDRRGVGGAGDDVDLVGR